MDKKTKKNKGSRQCVQPCREGFPADSLKDPAVLSESTSKIMLLSSTMTDVTWRRQRERTWREISHGTKN